MTITRSLCTVMIILIELGSVGCARANAPEPAAAQRDQRDEPPRMLQRGRAT